MLAGLLLQNGKVKIIAVTNSVRIPNEPDIPTVIAASIIVERLRRVLLRPNASLRLQAESVLHPPIAVEGAASASRVRREE